MLQHQGILDQNGAEELTPPGQAIFVRGMETITVMTPDLPDEEWALRLAALRVGEVELTDAEKLVLQAARGTRQAGKKPTVRGVYDRLKGRVGWNRLVTILGSLRERGLLLTKAIMSSTSDENGALMSETRPSLIPGPAKRPMYARY